MIKNKNLGQITRVLKVPGVATAAANKDSILVPFDGFISNIVASCASGGTGATNSIIDVNYQGTSIFSTSVGTKITFASTTGVATYAALATDPYSVTYGAKMTLDVDSISTNPAGINVEITFSKMPPSAVTNETNYNLIY